ncbi:MAG: hypothetical protein ACXWQO_13380 [Bdellovibrionota bacterium]
MNTIEVRSSPNRYVRGVALGAMLVMVRNKFLSGMMLLAFAFAFTGEGPALPYRIARELGLFSFLYLLLYLAFVIKLTKQVRENPGLLGPYRVTLEEEGLRWEKTDSNVIHRWEEFSNAWFLFGRLFLFRGQSVHLLREESFPDQAEFLRWRKQIKEKISSERFRPEPT